MAVKTINERKANNGFIAEVDTYSNKTYYRVPNPDEFGDVVFTTLDADGGVILPVKDHKTRILVQNTGSSAITFEVEAGDGYAGRNNLSVSVAANSIKHVELQTARYVNMYDGKIKVKGNGLKVAVIEGR